MAKWQKGDKVYIIETMGKKTVCTVVSSAGGFTVIKLPSGGGIRLRDSRIFPYIEEPAAETVESPLKAAGNRDPHSYMDGTSKFGP